jgi:RPA family protein
MAETTFIRHVAIKTTLLNVIKGEYIQESEEQPNYLLIAGTQKVFRLNIIATILNKERLGSITNLLIDDGTGKISLRIFEENSRWNLLKIGNPILIIGKLRKYNEEKYISPEIIKKISPSWLKVRFLELKLKTPEKNEETNLKKQEDKIKSSKEIPLEKIESKDNIMMSLPTEKMKLLIKELDSGEGVSIEELIEKSPLEDSEEVIKRMLEVGDIFQNSPGKVKLL